MRLMFVTYPNGPGMGQTVLDLDRVRGCDIRDDGVLGWYVEVRCLNGEGYRFGGVSHESAISLYEDIVNHLRSQS